MRGFSANYLRSITEVYVIKWQIDCLFYLFGQQIGPGSKPARQQRGQRRREFELVEKQEGYSSLCFQQLKHRWEPLLWFSHRGFKCSTMPQPASQIPTF